MRKKYEEISIKPSFYSAYLTLMASCPLLTVPVG